MQRVLFLVGGLFLAACRCDGPSVASRYGELVFVEQGSGGHELLVTDAELTAPTTFMRNTSELTVPVRNVGLDPVTIETVEQLEGDAAFSLDGAEGVQVDGTSDGALTVHFTPPQADDATLAQTAHHAKWKLTLSGAAPGNETLTLTVDGVGQARDCYVPARIDVGRVPLLAAVTTEVTVRNGGALAQQASVSTIAGADASAFFSTEAGTAPQVEAGAALTLSVRFSPLEERDYTASLTVRRDATCPEATVQLVGQGDDQALSWTPDALDFGKLPLGERSEKVVTIVNGSNAALRLSAGITGVDFLIADAPATLAPGAATEVRIACKPTALGPLTGQATLDLGTEPPTRARINLTCIGGGPRIRVDPSPIDFGQVPTGIATHRRLLVQNVGTPPPGLDDLTNNLFLGRDRALPWFSVVPGNAATSPGDFSVSLVGTYDPATGLPAIPGRNFAEFEVTVTHPGGLERRADLLVYSNDSKEPVVRVPLRAAAFEATACDVTIDPPGANFGPTPRGTVVQRTITVTNNATTGTCLISGIGMAAGSSTSFFVGTPSQLSLTVPAGSSRPITIIAVVAGDAQLGDYLRGTLELRVGSESDVRSLPVDLLVSQCLVVDPPTVDLGVVQTNCTSGAKVVTLYNICGVPIEVTGVSAPPAPFRITASPFGSGSVMLDAASHLTVSVAAAPTTNASWAGALHFGSVEGGTPQDAVVALTATSTPDGKQAETFQQEASNADILLVIDDSGSMADEQAALASNFQAFISSASSSPGNWHIGVITTDVVGDRGVLHAAPGNPTILTPTTPNVATAFAENVKVGVVGSGLEQPLDSLLLAITEPNLSGANAGFIRPNAALAVVIVTDALEQSTRSVGSYVSALKRLKNNRDDLLSVSVVGPFTQPSERCQTEGLVDDGRFRQLVAATRGVQTDICTNDWAMDLQTISAAVFATRTHFGLTGVARGTSAITVTVDGQVKTSGWSYAGATNEVVFSTPPTPGSTIVISYATSCF